MPSSITQTLPLDAFRGLDGDSLVLLFEHVRNVRNLKGLSATCKWIRNACKPILFSQCWVLSQEDFDIRRFVPPTLWVYVKSLLLQCSFPPLEVDVDEDFSETYDNAYGPLADALSRMPKLRTIRISRNRDGEVSWEAVQTFYSIPQLRELLMEGLLDSRYRLPPEIQQLPSLPTASLARVEYLLSDFRRNPRCYPADAKLFSHLATQENVQESLESLIIPSECAPLDIFPTADWPRLRKLSIRGQSRKTHMLPLLSVLARMPRLRALTLELAQLRRTNRQAVWPVGLRATFPWPELESLSISYPHPDDELYSHLPPTLRILALRCWPRHYIHLVTHDPEDMNRLGWYSPILGSSEMHRILRRCGSPRVDQLDVEFAEDDGDAELFRFIPSAFPNLTILTCHRYRRTGAGTVPAAAISEALGSLKHLRVLRIHLDFPDANHPDDFDLSQHWATLREAANVLALTLGSSVEIICLLRRSHFRNNWMPFRVLRDRHGRACAQYDKMIRETCGLSIYDDQGPPYMYIPS